METTTYFTVPGVATLTLQGTVSQEDIAELATLTLGETHVERVEAALECVSLDETRFTYTVDTTDKGD